MLSPQRLRLYEIDLLRFVAALSVLLFHYTFRAYSAHGIPAARLDQLAEYSRYGYLGVELFFMISGFVILLSAHGRNTKEFIRSRVLRLYPAYWIGVTFTALVLVIWGQGKLTVSFWQYLANLTMLHKILGIKHVDGVYWTLVVELKFYFLVWLLLRTGTMTKLRQWVWVWLGTAAICSVAPEPIGDRLNSLLISKWAPFFSVGIACFLLRQNKQQKIGDWLMLVCSGILAMYLAARKAEELSNSYSTYFSPTVLAAIIAAFTLIFAAIALDWSRVMRLPQLAHFGALTYPLYLLHAYIGYTLMRTFGGPQPNPYFVLTLVVGIILFAWSVHYFCERRIAEFISDKWRRP